MASSTHDLSSKTTTGNDMRTSHLQTVISYFLPAESLLPYSIDRQKSPSGTGFTKMPAEIRIMIWRQLLPQQPRFVEFRPDQSIFGESESDDEVEDLNYAIPTWRPWITDAMAEDNANVLLLLSICWESRNEARSFERLEGGGHHRREFYFNLERDVLCYNYNMLIMSCNLEYYFSERFKKNLRHLCLCYELFQVHDGADRTYLQYFTGLRELHVEYHNGQCEQTPTVPSATSSHGLRHISGFREDPPINIGSSTIGSLGKGAEFKGVAMKEMESCLRRCEKRNFNFKRPEKLLFGRVLYHGASRDPESWLIKSRHWYLSWSRFYFRWT